MRHDICHGHGAAHQAQQCTTPREARRGAGWSTCTWTTGRRSNSEYHQRSVMESVFAALKKMYGDCTRCRRPDNRAREISIRTTCYNIELVARSRVKRRQAHTGPNRNTRSVTGVFNTAPFLAEPPHHALDLEVYGWWRNMAQHGLSLAGSDACHALGILASGMAFFITRTHPQTS